VRVESVRTYVCLLVFRKATAQHMQLCLSQGACVALCPRTRRPLTQYMLLHRGSPSTKDGLQHGRHEPPRHC